MGFHVYKKVNISFGDSLLQFHVLGIEEPKALIIE